MNQVICVVCPIGCTMTITENRQGQPEIVGNSCPRGPRYAMEERTDPKRNVSGLVRVAGQAAPYAVRTGAPLKKALIAGLLDALKELRVSPEMRAGEIVLANYLNTGVDILITRGKEAMEFDPNGA